MLIIVFFYGLIIYPLSDIYAALFSAGSVYCFYLTKTRTSKKRLYYFFSGAFAYVAYNIRTIYLIIIPLLFILIIVGERKNRVTYILSMLAFFIGGILVFSIPQVLINIKLNNSLSVFVDNKNLFAQQLKWGLENSRYATNIGEGYDAGMHFIDKTGEEIIKDWNGLEYPTTISSYIRFFFKYPLEYVAIIGKHIINACFVLFPEQYIANVNKNLLGLTLLSLTIIIVSFVLVVAYIKNHKPMDKNKLVIVLVLIVPSTLILFGALEERFMLLPYMLIYAFISFYDYRSLKNTFSKKDIIIIVSICIVFVVISLSIESEILASLVNHPLIFNR